ncbi:MAG: S8 family serine peptidase, partial [Syntrophomonadaceae bacterium]|nr:S8 family serine peptidase [Syntrophomonadaceae bacterium]
MRFIRSNQVILLWTIGVTAILLLLNWLGIKGTAIALEEKKVRFLNDRASDIIGTRPITAPGLVTPPGLTGRGQIVGLADSGLDLGSLKDLHPDLQNISGQMPKVVLLKSWSGRATSDDPLGHGTHMAATIVGTGAASDGQFKGIAPGASLYFQALLDGGTQLKPPSDLHQLFYPAYSAGVRVHINGWGGGTCSYGNTAAQIDAFVRRYPDFLPLIAAGNSGPKAHSLTS